jgi:hypothetical protein
MTSILFMPSNLLMDNYIPFDPSSSDIANRIVSTGSVRNLKEIFPKGFAGLFVHSEYSTVYCT